jgi:hypothetical protein
MIAPMSPMTAVPKRLRDFTMIESLLGSALFLDPLPTGPALGGSDGANFPDF